MRTSTYIFVIAILNFKNTAAQSLPIQIISDPPHHSVALTAGGIPFTSFIYPDNLEKPVLYPIFASDGEPVTRGFPLQPRPGEPIDHPHHVGLWFNYENVNGLDFWNNSYAIPDSNKSHYGRIRTDSVSTRTGKRNEAFLSYVARWNNQQDTTLLIERTTFKFSADAHQRIIDRTTTLTAQADVRFPDAKDGMLGLRVTKELQIPSSTPGEYYDMNRHSTKVAAGNAPDINGNYLTSTGRTGDSAWGTRGDWCMMYGKKGADTLSVVIIDNPANPGYPTYWHARGYGLFAANPLGQKIFSHGQETLNFHLARGQSVTFRYRVVIAAGHNRLSTDRIRQLAGEFAALK